MRGRRIRRRRLNRAALRQHLNDLAPDDPYHQPIRRIVRDRLTELDQTENDYGVLQQPHC